MRTEQEVSKRLEDRCTRCNTGMCPPSIRRCCKCRAHWFHSYCATPFLNAAGHTSLLCRGCSWYEKPAAARRCEVGASGPHSRPRSSVVVTGSHRVVASVLRGFYRGTPVVFSSTKLIHEFGVSPSICSSGRALGPRCWSLCRTVTSWETLVCGLTDRYSRW